VMPRVAFFAVCTIGELAVCTVVVGCWLAVLVVSGFVSAAGEEDVPATSGEGVVTEVDTVLPDALGVWVVGVVPDEDGCGVGLEVGFEEGLGDGLGEGLGEGEGLGDGLGDG
jgi:hypothetical protein